MIYQSVFGITLDNIPNILGSFSVKIVTAILIFLSGFIIGKLAGKVLYKILNEIELNNTLKNTLNIRINVDALLSSLVTYSIYLISIIMALQQIGITKIIP